MISKTFPDNTGRSNRRAEARGDVPLYLLQTNALKDRINNALLRNTAGPNYVHFPDWIGEWFYDELTYEERGPDGKWKKPGRGANEAFDLMVYAHALVILRGYEKIKWEKPPPWAQTFEMTESSTPSPTPVPLATSERLTEQKDTAAPESKPSAWAPINSSGGWV
ncbi:Phage terminase large subunit [compost metagenome]